MGKKYTKEFKQHLVEEYAKGRSYPSLSKEYGVAKSTICSWVNKYSEECRITPSNNTSLFSAKEYHALQKRIAELEKEKLTLQKRMQKAQKKKDGRGIFPFSAFLFLRHFHHCVNALKNKCKKLLTKHGAMW